MADSVRFGILIPSFNNATSIGETLESLQRQTALSTASAVCLADDGSVDETVETARIHWRSIPALTILRSHHNQGERINVNRAIDALASMVDWVLVLHSDDMARPDWLGVMVDRMRTCPESVATICSSWDCLYPDGRVDEGENDSGPHVKLIRGSRGSVRHTLLRGCWWHISGCAIRVLAFREIGGFRPDLPQMGDWEWLVRCLKCGWDVEYIPRSTIVYRQHQGSVSSASFRVDRDITESLGIAAVYRDSLSWRDWSVFHARREAFCVRRIVRALLRGDLWKAMRSVQTVGRVVVCWASGGSHPRNVQLGAGRGANAQDT